jgi:GNAT superfamily N-acetyltransferase
VRRFLNGDGDMNDLTVRHAVVSDIKAIRTLSEELAESIEDVERFDLEKVTENHKKIMADSNAHILVGEIGGEIAGFISVSIRTTLLHNDPSALIDELVVLGNHRRIGVGKALVLSGVDLCRKLGCCEIEVSTEFSNSNARSFYKVLGFKERGIFLEREID